MNRQEAIEQLKGLKEHCSSMDYEIFEKDTEALDYIMKYVQDVSLRVGAVKVICRQKYYDPVLEDITNMILDMLGGNKGE